MRLTGTMTAIVTPFTADGSVDEEALRRHIQHQLDGGIDGLVPCGTTGETPTLTVEEYQRVVRTTVELAGGKVPIIAGTGSNSTRKTVELTRMARELGVDCALVVTPYYNKPGPAMLEAHYRKVALEGGLPIVLYNVPSRTGINLAPSVVHKLAKLDAIIAVKEAAGSLGQVQEILGGTDDQITVLSGDDALALPMYSVGAHGVISVAANVAPAEMKAVHTRFFEGDVAGAAALQAELFPLFSALFCETNPVPCKAALATMGRMTSTVREPLGAASEATIARLGGVLADLGLLT